MAGVIAGQLYVVGGNNSTDTMSVLQIYDPGTDSWTAGTGMPTARSQGSAVAASGLLYVIGGYLGDDSVTGVVEVYDPGADTWSTVTPMPTARGETVAAVIGGLVYVAGGNLSSNPSVDNITTLMEIYDPVGDSWSTGPPMLTPRGEAMEGVIGGKLYVAGGYFR
jgi:N-acetylneuraminic acid mutarotase